MEFVITSRTKLTGLGTIVSGYTIQGPGLLKDNNSYNIPPTAHRPIITTESAEMLSIGHWGYVPTWAKPNTPQKEVINARAETVGTKPFFKSSLELRRCLVPVTAFFEWHGEGKTKTPYRFYTDVEIFCIAGVYTNFADESGNILPHFALITTEANNVMAPVHDRMPVIVQPEREAVWLKDDLSDEQISEFLRPYPDERTKCYEISSRVNSVKNNDENIIKPVNH